MASAPHTTKTTKKLERAGFSLIELMTALAVAAVVLGIGIPSMRTLIQSQQLAAASSNLFSSINLARSEAVQRGMRVDLVPADGLDWSGGWVVFIDGNANQRPDAGENVVFSQGPVANGIGIKARLSDSKRQYIAYQGSGRTRTNASAQSPQFGSLLLETGSQQRKISINMLGRARVCNPVADPRSC